MLYVLIWEYMSCALHLANVCVQCYVHIMWMVTILSIVYCNFHVNVSIDFHGKPAQRIWVASTLPGYTQLFANI